MLWQTIVHYLENLVPLAIGLGIALMLVVTAAVAKAAEARRWERRVRDHLDILVRDMLAGKDELIASLEEELGTLRRECSGRRTREKLIREALDTDFSGPSLSDYVRDLARRTVG